jgi:hypothetical protein
MKAIIEMLARVRRRPTRTVTRKEENRSIRSSASPGGSSKHETKPEVHTHGRVIPRSINGLHRNRLVGGITVSYQYGSGFGNVSPHEHLSGAVSRLTICIQTGQRTQAVNRPEFQTLVIPPAASSGPKNFCTAPGCVPPVYICL